MARKRTTSSAVIAKLKRAIDRPKARGANFAKKLWENQKPEVHRLLDVLEYEAGHQVAAAMNTLHERLGGPRDAPKGHGRRSEMGSRTSEESGPSVPYREPRPIGSNVSEATGRGASEERGRTGAAGSAVGSYSSRRGSTRPHPGRMASGARITRSAERRRGPRMTRGRGRSLHAARGARRRRSST